MKIVSVVIGLALTLCLAGCPGDEKKGDEAKPAAAASSKAGATGSAKAAGGW